MVDDRTRQAADRSDLLGRSESISTLRRRQVHRRAVAREFRRDSSAVGRAVVAAPPLAARCESSGARSASASGAVALADVIASSRRRNFIISSVVLALLAGSFALLAVLARRAERQRLQQLEFVAGITHEVNTPLAALTSAGQNLADGVVSEPTHVKNYGAMVVKESRRLGDLVAQVLDFAGLQARGAAPRRERVDVASLIDEAIAQSRW